MTFASPSSVRQSSSDSSSNSKGTATAVAAVQPISIGTNPVGNATNNIICTPALTPDPDAALRLCTGNVSATGASPLRDTSAYFPPSAAIARDALRSPLSPLPAPYTKSLPEFPAAATAAAVATQQQQFADFAKDLTWDKTIERIIKGIVSIKASAVRAFDTEGAGDYTATGFVVDKKRGIILSNRHVVNPAPIIATAVFVNYEEVPLRPIYRDPVHDFGFFQYDPERVKFLDVEEIDLRPDLARVGLSIKVVGNDSGEKLSILGSTLARLDRAAPRYGDDVYEDFNTFYYQAATGTSGGSSGSPVLNISGQAIALNSGGSKRSASSFYLPLDRVVRALSCIQSGARITRGTMQAEFVHKSYDELRRLGLSCEAEALCRERSPGSNGLLTVARVLPGGPAYGKLEPGDMLFACDGVILDDFLLLFAILDERIEQPVRLSFYRGKTSLETDITVQDLHSITPDRFAEIGGGIFHDLSYQQARSYGMPVKDQGVYVALSGMLNWSALTRNFLVTSLNNKPTPNLDTFLDIVAKVPDGTRVPIRHKELGQVRETTGLVQIDRHFHLDHLFVRNDKTGVWDRTSLFPTAEAGALPVARQQAISYAVEDEEDDAAPIEAGSLDMLKQGLMYVNTRLPFSVNGYTSSRPYFGVGTLVSIENDIPIVVCDRAAVPSVFVDIRLTIQHHAVTGRVLALDRLAYLTFDMAALPPHIKLTVPEFDACTSLKVKDKVTVLGLDSSHSFVEKETSVVSFADVGTTKCNPPRFRLINVEGISLADSVACDGGIIVTKHSSKTEESASDETAKERFKIIAFWLNASSQNSSGTDTFWATGMYYSVYVKPMVAHINRSLRESGTLSSATSALHSNALPKTRTFNVECGDVSLSSAAGLGLSPMRIRQFSRLAKREMNSNTVQLINIYDKFPHHDIATNNANDLIPGDILLEIDGELVLRLLDVERHLQDETKESYEFVILREGLEKKVTMRPLLDMSSGAIKPLMVQWNGAFIHETFSEAIEQVAHRTRNVPLSGGVYVGSVSFGAPALNNIRPAQWIIEVDGVKVESIDQFIGLVKQHKWRDGEFVRVKQVNRKDVTSVVSVQVNERYWPTRCLERAENGTWVHKVV
ncbi:uncharacterized protein V1518DRAFT_416099 [Limtongia smithiae]|uniref:uncharacterized protein n=1 Tax=Limtongia smithiae TaxID=1125753 RepID=UPI0034CEC6D7